MTDLKQEEFRTWRSLLRGQLEMIVTIDPSGPNRLVYGNGGVTEELIQGAYRTRNACIYQALSAATHLQYPCGIADAEVDPGWPVAYIELPDVGQVSWHLPEYGGLYDGHSTDQKYERIDAWMRKPDAEL